MSKSRKSRAKNNNKPKKRKTGTSSRMMGGAQKALSQYLQLLRDPCGAELCHAPYLGTGSGYLMRTKTWVPTTQSTGAVDFYAEIHPGGVTSSGALTMGTYGYSTTAGGSLGSATTIAYPNALLSSFVGYFRPVAGCVRVHYLGAELDRQGMIGTAVQTGIQVSPGEVIGFTIDHGLGGMNRTVRLGTEPTELRFVPQESDGEWSSYTQESVVAGSKNLRGTSLIVMGQNIPPGSVTLEIVFVWEWQMNSQANSSGYSSGLQPVISKPLPFTLNDAISRIGDVVRFATSPDTVNTIGTVARGVYNVANKALPMLTMA